MNIGQHKISYIKVCHLAVVYKDSMVWYKWNFPNDGEVPLNRDKAVMENGRKSMYGGLVCDHVCRPLYMVFVSNLHY